eukprot:gene4277-6057_t
MFGNQRTVNNALWKDSIAGACAGVTGTLLGYPLDSIKTRMQVEAMRMSSSNITMKRAIYHIYQENGLMGFYRGVLSPLFSLTILNTLNFTNYNYFKNVICNSSNTKHEVISGWKIGLAGSCVGPFAAIISTPFELVKTYMQLNGNNKNSLSVTFEIIRTKGVKALYVGHLVNTTREVTFLSTYFMVYEHLKASFLVSNHIINLPTPITIAISGGSAGAIGWFISFPLDCIKSNIQSSSANERKSALETGSQLFRTKGILGLYSGVVPSVMRAFIVSSSRFMAYEACIALLSKSS